ncbi:MAG: hypothetical protein ABFD97_20315 [Syntrophobacter sp.]
MTDQKPYEGWAIVELFGHQQIAGMISEQAIGGASFVRVDVPELPGSQGFTKFYGGSAIYAITPTDEATATIAALNIKTRPVSVWTVPEATVRRQLPASDFYDNEIPVDDDREVQI